ncbi:MULTISPECIES: aldose 1-epimerase [Vreelandella]|uniref:Aldose 1-epimerase n=2 Tax=Vreelandella TaxID=3137766 RepID=A0A7C9NR99_9GAMM|nr:MULTISPECIES: aldose 1-epimerase [Halomonas]NDL70572.1 aldose 1-epimerase [Halomonas alkaliphila]NYS43738.1 aldose 1-epimerase [Halomonas zhaodongensis]
MHTLCHGDLEAGLLPSCGGAFSFLRWKGVDLLRPLKSGDGALPEGVRHSGGYVLAPYSNRIADASFSWQGAQINLRRNFGDHPHSLHGFAWQRAWECHRQDENSAYMVLSHSRDTDWPWDCVVTQKVSLAQHRLDLSLSIENLDKQSMPAGLGWHPYFCRTPNVQLGFAAEAVWMNNERQLPSHRVASSGKWDFRHLRELGWPGIDHCYEGWSNQAQIHWPEYRLRLHLTASEQLSHLVLFTPEARDFFALEPVSHANAALNRAVPNAHGMQTLAPGESFSCHLQLTLEEDHG